MLETLRRIVQEVNAAPNLEQALAIIVSRVKQAVKADVCSVYLTDFERRVHVLQASDGLAPESIGKVQLPLHRGLIGLVCERAEPVNYADATSHPRYLYVNETGESRYRGFLGVPIIQNRKVLGVLVVRRAEASSFGDNDVTFLVTLAAQLAGAITHAQASGELVRLRGPSDLPTRFLAGVPGSPGVTLGTAVVVYPPADLDAVPDRPAEDVEAEIRSLREAVDAVIADLRELGRRASQELTVEDRALFDAWILMLDSESLIERAIEGIRTGIWAPAALRDTIAEHARVFDSMDDAYLRERGSDVRDLGRRVLMYLEHRESRAIDYPDKAILVGEELSAIQLAQIPRERFAGMVSTQGSSSSHVAILARGMGVPAVMGVMDLPVGRVDGKEMAVDGYRGRVYVAPSAGVRAEYERLVEEDRVLSNDLEALRGLPSETTDGHTLPLYLNAGLVSESRPIGVEETAGVGLYRTELPFMIRDRFPGESDQVSNYRRVLQTFAPRPVTIRTLDVGGDKPLPYFPVNEPNPFLGWRGLRVTLDHPEIFLTQVRAMLRAAIGLDNLQILLPMVTTVREVDDALLLIHRAHDELREEGHAVSMPPVGAMIEVPAAVYQVEALARRVDFISVGTNDLTQYLLSVDRNNAHVARLYDELHPAVLRALMQIVQGARTHNRAVSVCGEMAGNPAAVVLLLGMGVQSLSMSAGSLLRVKWVIRSISRARARELLTLALQCETGEAVRRLLVSALDSLSLGALVRSGK